MRFARRGGGAGSNLAVKGGRVKARSQDLSSFWNNKPDLATSIFSAVPAGEVGIALKKIGM